MTGYGRAQASREAAPCCEIHKPVVSHDEAGPTRSTFAPCRADLVLIRSGRVEAYWQLDASRGAAPVKHFGARVDLIAEAAGVVGMMYTEVSEPLNCVVYPSHIC